MIPHTHWQQLALYAVVIAAALVLVQRIPFVGRIVRAAISIGLLALCIFFLLRQAPYDPTLAGIADRLGLDSQKVEGGEVRIRMASDGHFWARARIDGVERRMLIDSGATVTTLSEETAAAAVIEPGTAIAPVALRTANGTVPARTGTIRTLRLGPIRASHVAVVIAPGIDLDVLGMNFLSDLKEWRVEGRTLILVPKGVVR